MGLGAGIGFITGTSLRQAQSVGLSRACSGGLGTRIGFGAGSALIKARVTAHISWFRTGLNSSINTVFQNLKYPFIPCSSVSPYIVYRKYKN